MNLLRRLSYATLFLAFAQIVFGAIVRITGSGMGCGDHWPKCHGQWFPPLDRPDLIIEITHRYIALALVISIVGLVVVALKHRQELAEYSEKSVLTPLFISVLLVVTAAVFGAITVKLELNPMVVVIHKTIAILLLATLVATVIRLGGFGASGLTEVASEQSVGVNKTYRGAIVALVLALITIILGALTANVVGANGACQGFPLCRSVLTPGGPLHIHLTHRILAFLLCFHVLGMAILGRKRAQPVLLRAATWAVVGSVFIQIVIASMLVELSLPPFYRSLHQAAGTFIWLTVVVLFILARRANRLTTTGRATAKAALNPSLSQ